MFEKELEEYKNQSKWKSKIFMKDEEICFKDGAEFGYNKANEQLTKAKEIIKDYLTIAKGAHTAVCGVSEENRTINVLKLNKEAEQLLRSEL